ncbi:DUF4136 domain-containing protein [Pontibacter ruber]|uniref:DUF4136 domain-containing protein n=1 Tax=Pontibacter ruber TaxID=1343895 RepID=A0ABW5CX39_9BACT|nr:DUF4136 domain-containing protein [Pontibacter ruber]
MKNIDTKSKSLLLLLASILWAISCTPTMNVQSSYGRATSFDRYRTFAWYPAEAADNLESKTGFDTQVDRRIKTAVEAELVKKGLRPDAEQPDFLIAYDVAVPPGQEANAEFSPGFGYGYSHWYGYRFNYDVSGFPDYRSITRYPAGTLLIDFIDPDTNQLIWRGSAEGEIVPVQTDERKIRRSVTNILLQYPPGQEAMPTR